MQPQVVQYFFVARRQKNNNLSQSAFDQNGLKIRNTTTKEKYQIIPNEHRNIKKKIYLTCFKFCNFNFIIATEVYPILPESKFFTLYVVDQLS